MCVHMLIVNELVGAIQLVPLCWHDPAEQRFPAKYNAAE